MSFTQKGHLAYHTKVHHSELDISISKDYSADVEIKKEIEDNDEMSESFEDSADFDVTSFLSVEHQDHSEL